MNRIVREIINNFTYGMRHMNSKKYNQWKYANDDPDYLSAYFHGVFLLPSIVLSAFYFKFHVAITLQLTLLYLLGMESVREVIREVTINTEMIVILYYEVAIFIVYSNNNTIGYKFIIICLYVAVSIAAVKARAFIREDYKVLLENDDWKIYCAFYLPPLILYFLSDDNNRATRRNAPYDHNKGKGKKKKKSGQNNNVGRKKSESLKNKYPSSRRRQRNNKPTTQKDKKLQELLDMQKEGFFQIK
jgi:hypothetical protein